MQETESAATQDIFAALEQVLDPELGLDVVALGLVALEMADAQTIRLRFTPTSASCPVGELLREDVAFALAERFPAHRVEVRLSLDPPWSPDWMSARARAALQ